MLYNLNSLNPRHSKKHTYIYQNIYQNEDFSGSFTHITYDSLNKIEDLKSLVKKKGQGMIS